MNQTKNLAYLYKQFKKVRKEYRRIRHCYLKNEDFADENADIVASYYSWRGYYQGLGYALRKMGVKSAK